MWKKKKSDTTNGSTVAKGVSSMTTVQKSGSSTEYRLEKSFTSTSLTTSISSSSRSGNTTLVPNNPLNTLSRFPNSINRNQVLPRRISVPSNSSTDLSVPRRTIFETDARPFNSTYSSESLTGYTSPFNRQLRPYHSDRVPTQSQPLRGTSTSLQCNPQRSNDNEVPTYDTNGKRRGKVLVVNNVNFIDNDSDRAGAVNDEKSVSDLFKSMGFDVKLYRNLKKEAMIDKIKKFSSDKDLQKVDISIVILMSHGNNVKGSTVVPGGYTEISGTDGKGLSVDEVLDEFDTKKCSGMMGKPKIFFFQCCRGEEHETFQTDARPITVVRQHADMLIAHSTLPGFFSLRDTQKGSWYIQSVCNIFRENSKKHDVEAMLKMVDEDISKKHPLYKQTTSYECRGFKRCYLNPISR